MAGSGGAKGRPIEQPAVRTTIVGGRPPGSGKGLGEIPRGIEVLVKKASVDPDFKRLLLETRAEAAKEIELTLDPAEVAMLNGVPAEQLEAIIARTTVSPMSRAAFLGRAAAVMLAALSGAASCVPLTGSRPDQPKPSTSSAAESTTKGIRPDRPSTPPEQEK
jgi:hypothetical protein